MPDPMEQENMGQEAKMKQMMEALLKQTKEADDAEEQEMLEQWDKMDDEEKMEQMLVVEAKKSYKEGGLGNRLTYVNQVFYKPVVLLQGVLPKNYAPYFGLIMQLYSMLLSPLLMPILLAVNVDITARACARVNGGSCYGHLLRAAFDEYVTYLGIVVAAFALNYAYARYKDSGVGLISLLMTFLSFHYAVYVYRFYTSLLPQSRVMSKIQEFIPDAYEGDDPKLEMVTSAAQFNKALGRASDNEKAGERRMVEKQNTITREHGKQYMLKCEGEVCQMVPVDEVSEDEIKKEQFEVLVVPESSAASMATQAKADKNNEDGDEARNLNGHNDCEPKPTLVMFTTAGCPPCKVAAPEFARLSDEWREDNAAWAGKVRFVKVAIQDFNENPQEGMALISNKQNVKAEQVCFPTFVFFDKSGAHVHEVIGFSGTATIYENFLESDQFKELSKNDQKVAKGHVKMMTTMAKSAKVPGAGVAAADSLTQLREKLAWLAT